MPRNDLPVKIENAADASIAQDFDNFMAEMESDTAFFSRKRKLSNSSALDAELHEELAKPIDLEPENKPPEKDSTPPTVDHISLPSSNASPRTSPFESIEQSETSVSTQENGDDDTKPSKTTTGEWIQPDLETVAMLKRSMASSSRLIGTFTALKTTYLKLCKEFNFLLGKFNENEKIKIELIHENNELRKLLWETIKEKELDRKQYKADLKAKEELAKGQTAKEQVSF
ncbi:hypothetical protein JCM33374_g3760 [Metschnikowia sp. JCM 33374]|nr:hypothetical protein JCM33374_g3760 [Metschnikowia sp. JCM 33374]